MGVERAIRIPVGAALFGVGAKEEIRFGADSPQNHKPAFGLAGLHRTQAPFVSDIAIDVLNSPPAGL